MKKSPRERISPRSAASQADSANNNQVKPQTSSHLETTAFGSFQNQLGNQALHTTIEEESHSSIGAHYLENAIFQMGGVQLESEPSNSDQIGVLARKKSNQQAPQNDASVVVSDLLKQSGSPLPDAVKSRLERAFGAKLDHVRIHTNDTAAHAARSVQAKAFASGSDIAFARGAFDTSSKAGQELIAHEVAHVLQFDAGRMGNASQQVNGVGVSTPSDSTEREADEMAAQFIDTPNTMAPAVSESDHADTGSSDLVMRKTLSENEIEEDEPTEETEIEQEREDKETDESIENQETEETEGKDKEENKDAVSSEEDKKGGGGSNQDEEKEEKEDEEKEEEDGEKTGADTTGDAQIEEQTGEENTNTETTDTEEAVEAAEETQATEQVPTVGFSSTPSLRYKPPKMSKKKAEKIKKEKGIHPMEAFNTVTKKAEELVSLATTIKSNLIDKITSAEGSIRTSLQTQVGSLNATHGTARGKIEGSFEAAKTLLSTTCDSAIGKSKVSISNERTNISSFAGESQKDLEKTFTAINGQLQVIQESAPANLISTINAEGSKFDEAFTAALPKLEERFTKATDDLPNGSDEEKLSAEIAKKGLAKKGSDFSSKGGEQKEKYKQSILNQHVNNAGAIVASIVYPLRQEIDARYLSLKVEIDAKNIESNSKFESEYLSVEGTLNGVKDTGIKSVEASKQSSLSSLSQAQTQGQQALEQSGTQLINNLRTSAQQFGDVYNSQIEGLQPLMDQVSQSPDVDTMMPQLEQTEESIQQSATSHGETIDNIQSSAQKTLENAAGTYKTKLQGLGESSSTQINTLASTRKTGIDNQANAIVDKARNLSGQLREQIKAFSETMKEKARAAESQSFIALQASEKKMLGEIQQAVSQQKEFLTSFADQSISSTKTASVAEGQAKMGELRKKSTGLFDAMEGIGTDENAIFGHLRGLTPVQGKVLKNIYSRQFGKSLSGHLKSELDDALTFGDGAWRRASYALEGDAVNAAKLALKQSVGFFNDDEATIKAELRSLEAEELQTLQEMAISDPDTKDIIDSVRSNLGGEDLDIANTFLDATTDASGKILTPDVDALRLRADAIEIYHAMDGMGTDEEAVYKGLEGKTAEQRAELQKAYLNYAKEKYAEDNKISAGSVKDGDVMNLTDKIKDDFSYTGDNTYLGDNYEGDIAIGLLEGNEVAVKAARLEKASDGWLFGAGTDEKAILTQLKDANLKEPAALGDNPTPEQIQAHQKQKEAYDKAVKERAALKLLYEERYGRSIETMIGEEMGDDKDDHMGELARQTLQKGDGERSLKLKAATDGFGTNEDLIKEALQDSSGNPLSKEELKKLQEEYTNKGYGNLMSDLRGDLGGKDQFDVDILMMGKPTTPAEFRAIANKKYEYQRSGFSGAYMSMMGATGFYDSPEVFDRQKQELDQKLDAWQVNIDNAGPSQNPNKPPEIPKDLNEAYGFFNDGFESYEKAKMEVAEATGTTVAIVGAVALTVVSGGSASPALVAVLTNAGLSTTAATATAAAIGAMGTSALGSLSKAAVMGSSYGPENLVQDVASMGIEGLTAGGAKYLSILAKQGQSVKYLQPILDVYTKADTLTGPNATLSQKAAGKLLEALPENIVKELFNAGTSEANWDNDTVIQDFFMRMSVSAGGTAMGTVLNEAGGKIHDYMDKKLEGGNILTEAMKSEVFKEQFDTAFENLGSSLGEDGTKELLTFISDPQGYKEDFGSVFTTMMSNAGIKVSKGVVNKAIDQFKSSYNKTIPVLEMILKGETDTDQFKKMAGELTPEQKKHLSMILLMGSLNGDPQMDEESKRNEPVRKSSTEDSAQPESETELDANQQPKVFDAEKIASFQDDLGEERYKDLKADVERLAIKNPEAKAILEKLTMEEAIALRAYTGDGLISEYKGEVFEHALYSNVNRSLYTNNEEDQQKFDSFIETTNSALSKLPSYQGTVYRGANLPQAVLDNYIQNKGNVITEHGFLSTAYNPGPAKNFERNAFYVIESKKGKKIESLSFFQSPSENEVLFAAGSQFTVKDITTNEKGSTVIHLEEV